MPGKPVQFDDETWQSLDLLVKDLLKSFPSSGEERSSNHFALGPNRGLAIMTFYSQVLCLRRRA